MYINYEKIGSILKFGKDFFYNKKIEQNCAYIKQNIKKVKQKLKNKKQLIVAFYVYDDAKWKCQSVYNLMEKDERFIPYIFVTKNAAPKNNFNYQTIDEIKKVYDFFITAGMNTKLAYDLEKNRYIAFEQMNPKPDIIIYQHPWYVETSQGPVVCSKFALTYYIPYFISDSEKSFEYDLRFHKYIYKHYVPNNIVKNFYSENMKNKGSNLVTTGHPQLDYFYLHKNSNQEKKYLIYAPHWSVCGNNIRYSTFDWSGYKILEYAQKHPELNWIFKPHPNLYKFLFTSGYMSKKQADKYYSSWENIGIVCNNGNYLDLFTQSYAMITDSGSFLNEYLLTKQPLIHLESEYFCGNISVRKICDTYYTAKTPQELDNLLENIVIKKQDPKLLQRLELIKDFGWENNFCAKKILDDILTDFT